CRVRFERDLGGVATIRAHRVVHLTRASVIASAAASSAASVFVHSLPTVRALAGSDTPLRGCLGLKGVPHSTAPGTLGKMGSWACSRTLGGRSGDTGPQDGTIG